MMRSDLLPVTLEGKLDRLIEEGCEVTIAICKLRRFGENPTDPKTGIKYDNLVDLFKEMNDLAHAIMQVREHFNTGNRP
jgi:hypothetical protein